ncbi:hypothetical protein KCU79_g397, partial [Aureobasidium melanogenum]
MEDEYQRVIRDPPPECKPDSAALDAGLPDQEELQGDAGDFQWCDFAKYTKAIAQATFGGRLNKQVFDNIVAHIDYDLGEFINLRQDEFNRTALAVTRASQRAFAQHTPLNLVPHLRMSPPQVAHAHQPYSERDNYEFFAHSHTVDRQQLGSCVNTEPYPRNHDYPLSQNRSRHAHPLPRQGYARPDYSRGHNHDFARRSRSPSAHHYHAPTDHRDRRDRGDHRDRHHATKNRRGHSRVRYEQSGDASRRCRYQDRDQPSPIDNTGDHVFREIDPALLAPETSQESAINTSSTRPHPSPSVLPQETTTREPRSAREVVHTVNDGVPESSATHRVHPPAPQSPSTHGDASCDQDTIINVDNHDSTQATSDATVARNLTSAKSFVPSANEGQQQRNQFATCLECWLRGSTKCDGQVVCGECRKSARPCTYIRCPLDNCAKRVKCPAYHSRKDEEGTRLVGSPLHWMALLKLRPRPSPSLEVNHIQALQWNPISAQSVYSKIKDSLQEQKREGKMIDYVLVEALIVQNKALASLHHRALRPKANLIVSFVAEMKTPRYKALYQDKELLFKPGAPSGFTPSTKENRYKAPFCAQSATMVQTDSIGESLDAHDPHRTGLAAGHGADANPSRHNNPDPTSASVPAQTRTHIGSTHLPSTRFEHPPLVIRQTPVARSRQSTSSWLRRRSRSPITRPSHYRDRSQDPVSACRQSSATPDSACSGHHPDVSGRQEGPSKSEPIAPKRQPVEHPHLVHYRTNLSLSEVQAEKNKFSICVHCWLKDLPCDQKWPCRECKVRSKSCAYIACPLRICLLETKCPAYHVLPSLPQDHRKIGSQMHLVALSNLDRRFLDTYDMSQIHEMQQNIRHSLNIYRQLEEDIEQAIQQSQQVDDVTVRKMIKESNKVPVMGPRAIKRVARFIVIVVKEMKKQPFLELWEHDRRQRKFEPQKSDAMDVEDTHMLDSEE